ncbi:nitroreductase family deazaflavin-dependent oxidoreductase [Nocardia sp. CDC159]|uniref:Nitroreductase family deazaflavin-dependent oxidoreductase n=1 Tax=Nocardia pulmonis TaxID=2951408 RepID=A0A9X2EBS1_9NOCA|nr:MULTISPECIES: nitroreductase/quinone reductase family protein [Nocardia]MCM6777380.1 nitroreductase family deazaflavin-dependent oxidoreductase [Nocardia pulmonis]MCM6790265.1 nitroreductase family deazaflavin-dependent oxidoreductase [Nocardia sp. CDC159]
MSESTAAHGDRPEITSYDDPAAPWNQDFSETDIAHWNDDVIAEFRANDGKVGGAYEGADLLLLTTTGAKSGREHTVPLGHLYRGDTVYVSSFVEDKYPAWWHNIKANPAIRVELGGKTYTGRGRVLEGEEYREFADWVLANNPLLADFQAKIDRPIPLVVLEFGERS